MHEVGADKLALRAREVGVARQGVFHLSRTRFEPCQQVAVPAIEIVQYVVQEAISGLGIHRKDPTHDVIRPPLICRVEIPRLGRRPERANHDPRRIGPQIERLAVDEGGC